MIIIIILQIDGNFLNFCDFSIHKVFYTDVVVIYKKNTKT